MRFLDGKFILVSIGKDSWVSMIWEDHRWTTYGMQEETPVSRSQVSRVMDGVAKVVYSTVAFFWNDIDDVPPKNIPR